MKKILALAIVLASSTSFATRARISALGFTDRGGARHVNDVATIFTNPSDMMVINDNVTIESGVTNLTPSAVTSGTSAQAASNTGAEATVIRSYGDGNKWGFSLGHDDNRSLELRSLSGVATIAQQNPIELFYGSKMGEMSVAGSINYSDFKDKESAAKEKSSTLGVRLGAQTQTWDVALDLGLVDKYETGNTEFEGGFNFNINGGYYIDPNLYVYGIVDSRSFEDKGAGPNEFESQSIFVGVLETVKTDGNEFFYGVGINSLAAKLKDGVDRKISALTLPVIIGLETNAAEWFTLRGSITQDVIISNSKDEDLGTEYSPGPNTTKFSAGAGLKLGKVMLDGAILAGQNQNINFTNDSLLTTVGLTYNF